MFDTITGKDALLSGHRSVALVAPMGEFLFTGFDFTGATFRVEVRDRRDGGTLRAALDTVTTVGAEGVRLVSVETVDGIPVSKVQIRINQSTMQAMPTGEPGEDVELVWGMHIDPVGGIKFQAFDGPFIVKASAVA